jgi:hypothetical protein
MRRLHGSHVRARHDHLHVGAEDACAADHAAGRLAADDKHHLRHGDPQTCPVGMDDAPERFAARLRETLPQMNAPRPPFNANSFDEIGRLRPHHERCIKAAAAAGFVPLSVLPDGAALRRRRSTPRSKGRSATGRSTAGRRRWRS